MRGGGCGKGIVATAACGPGLFANPVPRLAKGADLINGFAKEADGSALQGGFDG